MESNNHVISSEKIIKTHTPNSLKTFKRIDKNLSRNMKKNILWMDEYLKNCEQLNRSPFTLRNYQADLEKFLKWFDLHSGELITCINGETITAYKQYISTGTFEKKKLQGLQRLKNVIKKIKLKITKNADHKNVISIYQPPLSVTSKRRHLSTIKNFFEFLKQKYEDDGRYFKVNPVKPKIHGVKVKDVDIKNTKLLSDQDWKSIEDHIYRSKEKALVLIMYYGGLRLNEARLLRWSDFNFKDKLITVKRKGGKLQVLRPMMAKKLFSHLEYWKQRENFGDNSYLFTGRNENVLSHRGMYSFTVNILKKASISSEITPHSFRKAAATKLYRKTKDLIKVRDFLGHSDAQVTQTYIENLSNNLIGKT